MLSALAFLEKINLEKGETVYLVASRVLSYKRTPVALAPWWGYLRAHAPRQHAAWPDATPARPAASKPRPQVSARASRPCMTPAAPGTVAP